MSLGAAVIAVARMAAAPAVLYAGRAVAQVAPLPGDLIQYGALGLCAFMVWKNDRARELDRKDRLALGAVIDERHAEVVRLNGELIKAIDRNTRAMEGCLEKQKPTVNGSR